MRLFSFTGKPMSGLRMASIKRMRSFWNDEHGSALIEGAVLLPILLVLMLGIYEFSWFFYQQHVMVDGLRGAARQLSRSPAACNAASPKWALDAASAELLAVTGSAA